MVPAMVQHDPIPDYEFFILPFVAQCDPWEFGIRDGSPTRNPVKWWLHCASYNTTGHANYFLVPFTIGIMPLTYLIAVQLTRDRAIGIVALLALIFNPLYSDWANQATYDNTWAFLLLLSFYLMARHKTASLGAFAASVAAKSVSIMYLPMWLYSIKANWERVITVLGFSVLLVVLLFNDNMSTFVGNQIGFFPERAEDALFINISVLWQVLPILLLFVGLNRYFIPKNRPANQKIIGVWILGILLMAPAVMLFTLQDMYSYRYVPLAVFISIFIGQTLVQVGNWVSETVERRGLKTLN